MSDSPPADITILRNVPQHVAQLVSASRAGEHFFREQGLADTGTLCSLEDAAALVTRAKQGGLVVADLTGDNSPEA